MIKCSREGRGKFQLLPNRSFQLFTLKALLTCKIRLSFFHVISRMAILAIVVSHFNDLRIKRNTFGKKRSPS